MRNLIFFCTLISLTVFSLRAQEQRIYFPLNGHKPTQENQTSLREAARNCKTSDRTELEGRAGSSGSVSYNLELSARRAESVREALIREGCPPEKIFIQFTGESQASQKAEKAEDRVVIINFRITGKPTEISAEKLKRKIQIEVFDRITRKPINATGNFLGISDSFSIPQEGLNTEAETDRLKITAPGYRDTLLKMGNSDERIKVFLIPSNIEEVIVTEQIYFQPNTALILPESFRTLDYIFKQLENKKDARIEVHGHVNWPVYNPFSAEKERENQKLSEDRAETVKKELIKRGFVKENITAKGFGSSRMVFPEAVSEAQQAQNRRVEILIMAPAEKGR